MTRLARQTFASLAVPNYRRFLFGMLVSHSGTWMQSVAQAWLVLQLTGSGTAVGLVVGAQTLPMLLGGMWGGVVADRFDKRRTLLMSQTAMAVVAGSLAAVTLGGVVELWMVFTCAALTGMANAVDHPTRQAFVSELVGPDRLANAVALNSAVFNSARTVGPALGGAAILAGGPGTCFAVNAVSYIAVIVALVRMRTDELNRAAPAARSRGQIRAGLRYALGSPDLRPVLLLIAVVGTFALNFHVLLPLLARFTFDGGPGMLGLLTAVFGAGSVVGALVVASHSVPRPRLLASFCALFGVIMLGIAAAPGPAVAVVLLAAAGGATITFMSTANSMLQLRSSPEMRGRVMSLYVLVFLGSTPVGGPLMGAVSERFGPRAAFVLGGVAALAGVLALSTGLLGVRGGAAARSGRAAGQGPALEADVEEAVA